MYIFKMTEVTMFLHDGHKIQFTYTFVMWERPMIIKLLHNISKKKIFNKSCTFELR